jgi:hypothetical protein
MFCRRMHEIARRSSSHVLYVELPNGLRVEFSFESEASSPISIDVLVAGSNQVYVLGLDDLPLVQAQARAFTKRMQH